MRYIRTKDGIYEVISSNCGWEIPVYANNDFGEKYIQEDDIIKQADTIEELCDEFVLLHEDKTFSCQGDYDVCKEYYENGFYLYGAIWTDKGLIYVAKMNEKGELELLWFYLVKDTS